MSPRRTGGLACIALLLWGAFDLLGPFHADLRRFDPRAIARVETEMWRAYYEKRPVGLYFGLVKMLRTQQGFPWLRANLNAYRAARAAVIFQRGRTTEEYARAVPFLNDYFASLCAIGRLPGPAEKIAEKELAWWVIHRREGTHNPKLLTSAVADAAGALYGEKPEKLKRYATLRTQAMLRRDDFAFGSGVTEDTWRSIGATLEEAYAALLEALHPGEPI